MRDADYHILYNEVMAVADYAKSSRTLIISSDYYKVFNNPKTFYEKLLYWIVHYKFDCFLDNFVAYSHVRLKIALTTRDFSCLESIIWICYKFFNNENVSSRSKNEVALIDYLGHKFLCLTREYQIFSPIQKFSEHKNIISSFEFYAQVNFKNVQAHVSDFKFMIEYFKNIALIDDNIQMKPYYNIKDLQCFETLPEEVRKVVQPLRDLGYI